MHLPPGPRSALIATVDLIRDPYEAQRKLRARYGDVMVFPALNGQVVFGLTPAFAKAVFTADPEHFGSWATDTLVAVLGRESLLVSEGEPHKRDRKLLTPPFHGARMRTYGEQIRSLARTNFTARLSSLTMVNTHEIATKITIDVILGTVFGVNHAHTYEEGRAILGAIIDDFRPSILFTKRLHVPFFPPWQRYLRTRERFNRWLKEQIEAARKRNHTNQKDESVLGLMLEARYDDGSPMGDDEIAVQLLTLLIAGHETTSISIAWAVHWLLHHPDALARVRAEVDALGPDADPEAISKLPYLTAVCDETLRLHPIVTEVLRTVRKPLRVPGPGREEIEVPAGFGVGVGIATIHEDPAIYKEPHAFRPERFLERKYGPFEFLPFGGGHRRCIGAAFAQYEMKLVLATLISEWNIELMRSTPEKPIRRSVTMGPEYGVPIRVIGKRKMVRAEAA
jgi:cytochrome P450